MIFEEMRLLALVLACRCDAKEREEPEQVVRRAQKYLTFLDPTYGVPVNMTKEGAALPVAKPARRRMTEKPRAPASAATKPRRR